MTEALVIKSTKHHRVYRAQNGTAVSCKLVRYTRDEDFGTGWCGWCGVVEDQSDYVLGPYESPDEVFEAYEERNPEHEYTSAVTLFHRRGPKFQGLKDRPPTVVRLHRKCILCFKQIPARWPNGDQRLHCDACCEAP